MPHLFPIPLDVRMGMRVFMCHKESRIFPKVNKVQQFLRESNVVLDYYFIHRMTKYNSHELWHFFK